jgi:aspartokinase/homoserine dehydrogenase 1
MKVLKFGGSSVQNAERIQNVIHILNKYRAKASPFAVVFSAFGGITDLLISAGRLAEAGKPYEDALFEFANRHRKAAEELLPNNTEIQGFLTDNLTELNNLLYGV